MPRALVQQPLSYIPTARPLDHVRVTHDDQPIGRRDSPPVDGQPHRLPQKDRVQAMVDVAVTYLETPPGEPADHHTLVVVHVNAEALDVPAGTSVDSGTCYVEGHGPIEPATAERLLCTARVQGVLVGRGGKVLSLGRTKRLATVRSVAR